MFDNKSITKRLTIFYKLRKYTQYFNRIVLLCAFLIVCSYTSFWFLLLILIPSIITIWIMYVLHKNLNIDVKDINPDLETFKKNYFKRKYKEKKKEEKRFPV